MSDFDDILYERLLATTVVIFRSKNPCQEIYPQIGRDFLYYKGKWQGSSDFDEISYARIFRAFSWLEPHEEISPPLDEGKFKNNK